MNVVAICLCQMVSDVPVSFAKLWQIIFLVGKVIVLKAHVGDPYKNCL